MTTNNKISNLINTQVPFFVRKDHRTFIAFLEAYYEYLEQTGKVTDRTKNLLDYVDVDRPTDEFLDYIYNKYLRGFPYDVLANKPMLIKNAKDFWRSKGTEKSLKFLLRVLYNEEADIYYPKKDILTASGGKWFIQKSLRVSNTKVDGTETDSLIDFENFIGKRITGNTSEATATVERIDRFYEAGSVIDELIISSVDGTFENGETVRAFFDNDSGTTSIITSNVFSGIINSITIVDAGSRYNIGDPVIILSSSGSGACAVVGRVSTGNISSISVINGGAGFQNNNYILVSGGGGTGANGYISSIDLSETYHPNSYNLLISTINLESNTLISNAQYANLCLGGLGNANTTLANTLCYFVYANTGPAVAIHIDSAGSGYTEVPSISIIANSFIQSLGILGRMEIANAGSSYVIGDKIDFINPPGTYGFGAQGNVKNVSITGGITEIEFEAVGSYPEGGFGYDQSDLPTANISTSTGSGGQIEVQALLGYGGDFAVANSTLGAIERITLLSRGTGYTSAPTINLTNYGDGTAQATATIVTGVYTYPGRYLNDDGHISSFSFLQDRDYYQNYSYVVRVKKSINEFRGILKDLINPSGVKVFGEYLVEDESARANTIATDAEDSIDIVITTGTYVTTTGNSIITLSNHTLNTNDNVYLEFISGANVSENVAETSNITNGFYVVVDTTATTFNVIHYNSQTANASGSVLVGTIVI